MGGLGPGIGGAEYLVIAIVALLVVGPERLPALLNKLGKMVAKARNMANEFRSSFDEMARQSELDDLRKEVEALRRGQTNMMPLGPDADATFRSISDDLNRPLLDTPKPLPAPDEWPDPVATAVDAPAEPATVKTRKPRAKVAAKSVAKPAKAKATTAKAAAAKPRAPRKTAVKS
jgi:sec-independent protein translocase protein TatB